MRLCPAAAACLKCSEQCNTAWHRCRKHKFQCQGWCPLPHAAHVTSFCCSCRLALLRGPQRPGLAREESFPACAMQRMTRPASPMFPSPLLQLSACVVHRILQQHACREHVFLCLGRAAQQLREKSPASAVSPAGPPHPIAAAGRLVVAGGHDENWRGLRWGPLRLRSL